MSNLTNEDSNNCDVSKFLKSTAALVIKQFILFIVTACLFFYNFIRSFFKVQNVRSNRVFILPIEGVVDIWTNFADLLRENLIGFVTCTCVISRALLRAFGENDGTHVYNKTVMIVWIIDSIVLCCYNFQIANNIVIDCC